eukprot:753910-Pyramimonas_sp.AAC.1
MAGWATKRALSMHSSDQMRCMPGCGTGQPARADAPPLSEGGGAPSSLRIEAVRTKHTQPRRRFSANSRCEGVKNRGAKRRTHYEEGSSSALRRTGGTDQRLYCANGTDLGALSTAPTRPLLLLLLVGVCKAHAWPSS